MIRDVGLISCCRIWLGIRDDYRTLIGVNGLDIIEKKNEEQNEENSHV